MGCYLFILGICALSVPNPTMESSKQEFPVEVFAIGKPIQKAEWGVIPNVRVCAAAELSPSHVGRAINYWERLGYKFDEVYKDYSAFCIEPKYGEILITLPSGQFDPQHMASTNIYTSNKTGEIVKAKIHMIPKNGKKERVLEHEIGHALGWNHYNQKYHIMHPNWHLGGHNSTGLSKK